MKLIMAVVNKPDSKKVVKGLMDNGFQVTRLATVGGAKGTETLTIATSTERLDIALNSIKTACRVRSTPISDMGYADNNSENLSDVNEITLGGATVYVLSIDKAIRM